MTIDEKRDMILSFGYNSEQVASFERRGMLDTVIDAEIRQFTEDDEYV